MSKSSSHQQYHTRLLLLLLSQGIPISKQLQNFILWDYFRYFPTRPYTLSYLTCDPKWVGIQCLSKSPIFTIDLFILSFDSFLNLGETLYIVNSLIWKYNYYLDGKLLTLTTLLLHDDFCIHDCTHAMCLPKYW